MNYLKYTFGLSDESGVRGWVGKREFKQQSRYASAKQFKQAGKA